MPKTLYTEHDMQVLVTKGTTVLHMDDQLDLHPGYAPSGVEAAAV